MLKLRINRHRQLAANRADLRRDLLQLFKVRSRVLGIELPIADYGEALAERIREFVVGIVHGI